MRAGLVVLLLLLVAACLGDPMGTECEFRGSGFHASTNCANRCLQTRPIECPNGERINPHVCSGKMNCEPGSCSDGAVCYTVQDPFDKESFCIEQTLCGEYSGDALSAWELSTQSSAAALRAEYEERKRLRESNPTKVSADVDLSN